MEADNPKEPIRAVRLNGLRPNGICKQASAIRCVHLASSVGRCGDLEPNIPSAPSLASTISAGSRLAGLCHCALGLSKGLLRLSNHLLSLPFDLLLRVV